NCLITLNRSGEQVLVYNKIHLITYYDEEKTYREGSVTQKFVINDFNIIPTICYDLRFSYLFWENAPITDAYVVIANWPAERDSHWKSLLKARAIENQSYVIGVNRIGKDLNTEYLGNSLIISPNGEIVLDSGNSEGIAYVDIKKEYINETRKSYPFLNSRKKLN
ncbi:MAG: nitrilase-related carbon-nitrogen hydrolase, partial [SAR202 cluster bacterium]|nr:nitrilase-related carbon-nitrogen hydrolase [SAR202 cluster bacterium]